MATELDAVGKCSKILTLEMLEVTVGKAPCGCCRRSLAAVAAADTFVDAALPGRKSGAACPSRCSVRH
jgi:hypothetical protein